MATPSTSQMIKDKLGIKILQWWNSLTESFTEVSNANPLPVTVVDGTIAAAGSGSHVYGYNGSNQLITDTWTVGTTTRVKTYTYTGALLTGESDWVDA